MNIQRLGIAIVVIYLVLWGLATVLYEHILAAQFAPMQAVTKAPEAMGSSFPVMLIGYLVQVTLFCVIFTRNHEGKGIGEGVRFGLLVGGLIAAVDLVYGATLTIPLETGLLNAVLSLILWVIAGIVLALIYRPKAA